MEKRVDLLKFKDEQIKLAKRVVLRDSFSGIKTIGGADRAFIEDKIICSIVICEYSSLEPIEKKHSVSPCRVPYIPEYQSYRESPALIEAFNKIINKPDLLIIKGNGILHPRRMGMASHIGILLNIPVIGVTNKLLYGEFRDDKIIADNEIRGAVLVTREHSKPLYISPGHNISLNTAVEIIRQCIRHPHKLPEPLHLAHRYANIIREEYSIHK